MIAYDPWPKIDGIVRFDSKQGRMYRTPEGNEYRSVTSVLADIPNGDLDAWKARVGQQEADRISKAATVRGSYVHFTVEQLIKGDGGPLISTNIWNTFVKQIWDYLIAHDFTVRALEFPLYSDTLKLAGTVDLVLETDNRLVATDLKTSKAPKELYQLDNYHLQLSIYSYMIAERYHKNIPNLRLLIATELGELQVVNLKRMKIDDVFAAIAPRAQRHISHSAVL